MSVVVRPAAARGKEAIDWLDSRHSFSFGHYYDPEHMGFRALRVINEDTVLPGAGFATHGHRDMEIITYVVEGALAHRDSTGAAGVLRRGDVQAMSAGTGVRHSEINPSPDDPVRFLQIWILPERTGLAPAYRQAHFADAGKRNTLRSLVAPDEKDGAMAVHQDVSLFASLLEPGVTLHHDLRPGRAAWLQIVEGSVRANGQSLGRGDGAAISEVEKIEIIGRESAEFLLFDLA